MPKRQIFYSFHFDNDVMRVQQIRNIGTIEGNPPASPNEWEEVKKKGDDAIKKWINANMQNRSCVIVLIGTDTWNRKFVKYEIEKAWTSGKGLLGIYIHNMNCPRTGKCAKGKNPFEQFPLSDRTTLSSKVKCYDPLSSDAYNDIANNIAGWIEAAIASRS